MKINNDQILFTELSLQWAQNREQNHFVGSVIILASTTQSTADIMVQVHLPARGEEKKKQLRTL